MDEDRRVFGRHHDHGVRSMSTVWVLVADAARAKLFELRHGDPTWHVMSTFAHEQSREKTSALVTDHLGQRSSQGRSAHHNALAPSSSPHEVEKEHFAHTLATMLDDAVRANRFEHLVIAAAPHFLGLLKSELSPQLHKRLMATVDKDLNHLDIGDLSKALTEAVSVPVDQRDRVREHKAHPH